MYPNFLSILPKIVPLLVLLIMGYIFDKKDFLSNNTISEIKYFILNITLPALLFTAFLDIELRTEYLLIILLVLFLNIFMLFIGKIVSPLIKSNDPYLKLMFAGFEMGMFGIPLFTAIYGIENVKYIGIVDIGHEVFIWFILLGIIFKLSQDEKESSYIRLFKSFISSPVIIAILLGLLANIIGFGSLKESNFLVLSFLESIEIIAGLTVPLILIIIGYEMEFKAHDLTLPLKIIGIRMLTLMPLALIINRYLFIPILKLENMYNVALFTMIIMPPPFIIPLFIREKELETRKYIYNTLSLSTLISISVFIIFTIIGIP